MSASYTPKAGAAAEAIVRDLHDLTDRHADAVGLVRLRYTTRVYTARALPA
jgi:hypothetical protein